LEEQEYPMQKIREFCQSIYPHLLVIVFVSTRKVDTIAVEFVSNYHVMFVSNYHVMLRDDPGRYSAKNHRKPNRITTVTSFRNQL